MEHLVSMLPMMMASLRVHVPGSHKGISIPAGEKRQQNYKRIHAQNPLIREKQRKAAETFCIFFFILSHQRLVIYFIM